MSRNRLKMLLAGLTRIHNLYTLRQERDNWKRMNELSAEDALAFEEAEHLILRSRTISEEERKRLRLLYPHFEFQFAEQPDEMSYARLGKNGTSTLCFNKADWELTHSLDAAHRKASIALRLMELYPSLYLSVSEDRNGSYISIWIKRDGRDGEGIRDSMIRLDVPELHIRLGQLNEEATDALQPGWFYCYGHNAAEEKKEGTYHWFASLFCARYGEENPEHRRKALNERYN